MPSGLGERRHGRDVGLGGLLVEREREQAAISQALVDARESAGRVVCIEAPGGKGKSRLISIAGDMTREAGFRVLGAHGTELEHEFPFGIVIQLFEPLWLAAEPDARARLSLGAAQSAVELLEGGSPQRRHSPVSEGYPLIHGLFWLTRNLIAPTSADRSARPLAILVDDAHWADSPSLRFLAYLAKRIAELPIVLVLAVRPGDPTGEPVGLSALRDTAGHAVLRPQALSDVGVATIVRSRLPAAEKSFILACARLTSGNPFLLSKLLDQVEQEGRLPDAATALRLSELTPEAVLNSVVARLGAMPSDAVAVARALAILGDGSPVGRVARLAQVSTDRVIAAADALGTAHILRAGSPLSFVHPLIQSAVRASIAPLERARAHRLAATIMLEDRVPDGQVAAQLLYAPAESDVRAAELLRSAAREALVSGAPDTAVRMLERAREEMPETPESAEIIAELAEAEAAAGLPSAVGRLQRALELSTEHESRTRLRLRLVAALLKEGRMSEAAELLRSFPAPLPNRGPLADELDATLMFTARFVPGLRAHANARSQALLARVDESPTAGERRALAEAALNAGLGGAERATVVALVERSWSGGALLDDPHHVSWRLLTGALLFVDELERALELCQAATQRADLPARGLDWTVVSSARAWPLYEQGKIDAALAEAETALAGQPDEWSRQFHLRTAYVALALCLIERGELERAELALSILEHPDLRGSLHLPHLLEARGRLRLAQLRPQEAATDAAQAGQLAEELGTASPGAVPWRTTAALAHLALGARTRARALATEELELAQGIGIARVSIRALRCLALVEHGQAFDTSKATGDSPVHGNAFLLALNLIYQF